MSTLPCERLATETGFGNTKNRNFCPTALWSTCGTDQQHRRHIRRKMIYEVLIGTHAERFRIPFLVYYCHLEAASWPRSNELQTHILGLRAERYSNSTTLRHI
jgi:hypothetical protein